jgi:hypothetical protein
LLFRVNRLTYIAVKYILMKDRTGEKYGRLTVIKYSHKAGRCSHYWVCKCDCGNTTTVQYSNLKSGNVVSCRCLNKEITSARSKTHGLTKHECMPIYRSMIRRCTNPVDSRYIDYGGRGIRVCEEWLNPTVFIDWCTKNGYQKGLEIDRIINSGNYEPSNCRFVTRKENARNRRSNVVLEYNGTRKILVEWCEELGLNYDLTQSRLKSYGWTVERAFNTKVR